MACRLPGVSWTCLPFAPSRVEPAVFQAAFQTQQLGGGLGHIHINGIELLNGGQGVG